jgi:hypothetical protein
MVVENTVLAKVSSTERWGRKRRLEGKGSREGKGRLGGGKEKTVGGEEAKKKREEKHQAVQPAEARGATSEGGHWAACG